MQYFQKIYGNNKNKEADRGMVDAVNAVLAKRNISYIIHCGHQGRHGGCSDALVKGCYAMSEYTLILIMILFAMIVIKK